MLTIIDNTKGHFSMTRVPHIRMGDSGHTWVIEINPMGLSAAWDTVICRGDKAFCMAWYTKIQDLIFKGKHPCVEVEDGENGDDYKIIRVYDGIDEREVLCSL